MNISTQTLESIGAVVGFIIIWFVFRRLSKIPKRKNEQDRSTGTVAATTAQLPSISAEDLEKQARFMAHDMATFTSELEKVKEIFPFERWYEVNFKEYEMEQYTKENCEDTEKVLLNLIEELKQLGVHASEEDKLDAFMRATIQLNVLDEANEGLIETGEREDLCEIMDRLGWACGLIPHKYGAGDGIASEWRDW